ncbi:hypothetical protein ACIHDR_29685 [Nocardia sp. NPDC052278]|uniref:hypothetical protein n=1 Tax=unclassified Nocardia TaxID=2637762 RepID=UPI00369DE6CD
MGDHHTRVCGATVEVSTQIVVFVGQEMGRGAQGLDGVVQGGLILDGKRSRVVAPQLCREIEDGAMGAAIHDEHAGVEVRMPRDIGVVVGVELDELVADTDEFGPFR